VARLDEIDFLVRAIERAEDAVDAITGISEQDPDSPLVKPIDHEIADCLCHGRILRKWWQSRRKGCTRAVGTKYRAGSFPYATVSIGGVMSLFDTLKNAIFGHAGAATPAAPKAAPPSSTSTPGPAPTPSPTPAPKEVDVEAVLTQLNAKSPQKLNWQTSIVDLMKLVGMDSSLQHRKELAAELGYKGDPNDSAAMNVWLHKAVMQKLAANGGKVPDTLK
jgi:hypothetical protein